MAQVLSTHCQRKRDLWLAKYGEAFMKIYSDASLTRQQQADKLNVLGIPTITGKLGSWSIPSAQQTYLRMSEELNQYLTN